MALHYLPTELLAGILRSVDSPRDLVSFIIASAPCYDIFKRAPMPFISSVVRNAIEPAALPHALALVHLISMEPSGRQEQNALLTEYFRACDFAFPTDMQRLRLLRRLSTSVTFFIDDYTSRAMRALTAESSSSSWFFSLPFSSATVTTMSPLTSSERARFQRAFFRYELWCTLYPPSRWESHSLATSPALRLLARMAIWEVEELSCVHEYYVAFVNSCIESLEDQFVAAVLAMAPSTAHTPPGCRQGSLSALRVTDSILKKATEGPRYNGEDPSDELRLIFPLGAAGQSRLNFFTQEERCSGKWAASYLAAFGCQAMYQLASADEDARRNMIRRHPPTIGRFFPHAIGTSRRDPDANAEINRDSSSCLNSGLPIYRHLRGPLFRVINCDTATRCALRERAYIFWDSKRVLQAGVNRALNNADLMNQRSDTGVYDDRKRPAPERRLQGVKVSRVQMDRLVDKFGALEDLHELEARVTSWAELLGEHGVESST